MNAAAFAHLALGAAPPLAGWWLLRRAAGAGLRQPPARLATDLAPAALLWALLLAATARPVLAGCVVFSLALALALADTAKRRVLGEPVVFSDVALLSGVVRHPGLYLPFAGPARLAGAAALLLLAPPLAWLAEPPLAALAPGGRALLAAAALGLAWPSLLRPPSLPLTGDPAADAAALGPCAALARQRAVARAERPARRARLAAPPLPLRAPAPHLVLVQAESFCDPRRLCGAAGALPRWEALRAAALQHGRFAAPAFGANTMRAEFGVLTGLPEAALGLDRFHPYFRFARVPLPSLASALGAAGYATACLHPFDRRFFGRHRALPALGFQRFLDARAFAGAPRVGAHVADAALGARVIAELRAAATPLFLFVITMQAHGPWPGPDPLDAWLAHLRDTDAMLGAIADAARGLDRPLLLAAYGDHLPAVPQRPRDGLATDYLLWRSDRPGPGARRDLDPAGLHAALRAALAPP
ncbi:LTA synthase family protein [Caldovatus aquaticus]|uniref:LTA synthase family protein n=1 Tax=Caldovatus aquaticus TaxID=2865671 RepID=A0ABS7F7J1_9PROT|nr:LTA synthase family protein [Caldovatus aquaticus]MBW8271478.1 LTA synthase family protein [Caldovatus aquaticus]